MDEFINVDGLFSIFVGTFHATILTFTGLITLIVLIVYVVNVIGARTKKKTALIDKHVLVTGGSSGIGRSVAIEAAARGANVTIVARNQSKLNTVKQEVINACIKNSIDQTVTQTIQAISLDVTSNYETIEKALRSSEEDAGPVYMIVNCAGSSLCSKFEDTPVEDFKKMLDLNLLGSLLPTKAIVPGLKAQGAGHIVFTASQAALLGIYGYTAYSASKFALRGLAEALYMEVKPYGVSVTLALPPDTDTPGFTEEEKTKLPETRLISQSAGLLTPDSVASQMLDDAIMGRFFSTVGFEGNILITVCAGMSPLTSLVELFVQVLFMGIVRLISVGYLISFENIVKKCMRRRDRAKKSE